MKSTKVFCFWVAAALFLSGCAKEPVLKIENDGDRIPLNISSSINQEHTKATAEGFADKDALGLFAVNWTENNAHPGTLQNEGNQADNVKYVFDWSNQKWNPVKPVYYKDINTHADLFLYYPYLSSINDVAEANFEVKQDQSKPASGTELSGYEASDFLWGKGENITPTQSRIAVPMSHRLSAVLVVLQEKPSGSGFAEDEFASLDKSAILTNTTRKATIDFSTGTASPLGSAQLTGIVMCPQEDNSFRAIAIPQTVAGGKKLFSITIGGQSYSYETPSDAVFEPGKMSKFTLNVTKKTPSGDYAFELADLQIIPWVEDRNSHGGEARQYFVVNVTEPGTLGATIKAMGKNPDKIRNLKVVGNVRDDDFYFMRDSMAILEAVNMKESVVVAPNNNISVFTEQITSDEYKCYCQMLGQPNKISGNSAVWYDVGGSIPTSAFSNKKSLCYFSFPENISTIGPGAFNGTNLSGALILPDSVVLINGSAFANTNISSVAFSDRLLYIGNGAFSDCFSISGQLILPNTLLYIGSGAFKRCGFSGELHLPESLTYLGSSAFVGDILDTYYFTGNLVIPDKITTLYGSTFRHRKIKGNLVLNNVTKYEGSGDFENSGLSGELIIPEGTTNIPGVTFSECNFSSVYFPSSLRTIEGQAFRGDNTISNVLEFPEGLVSIGGRAFYGCSNILGLIFPQSLQTIQQEAFSDCYYISKIISNSVEPITVQNGAFNGVAKDNFAVEVPEQSIISYKTEAGWSDFKRITAHYDFSIGRIRIRTLNAGTQKTLMLRCPAGEKWAISDEPDWITVSPSSGTGRTDVTITVGEMPRTNEQFEVNNGSYNHPNYKKYNGRKGSVIFNLSGKDYTCSLDVEQYDYDKADGETITHQTHSVGNGIDIVFIGEGYDAKDIADGKFENNCTKGFENFFAIEPYKSYRNYFNVYSVISQSGESGIETVNTIIENKFMKNGVRDVNAALSWAKKARVDIDLSKTVVILLDNSRDYYGWTNMYGDGSAMSVIPISEEAYPYDFRGLIQHEAGGHAFGKLGDEYIYHNAYITSCGCCCCDHPSYELDPLSQYGLFKSKGWFRNLSMEPDHNSVPWSHLMFHIKYSDRVDMYEGAYMHTRAMYRSEITSCMNNNIPYYNSISRQAIVERIKEYAGETFDFEDFVAKDNFDVGTKALMQNFDWTFGVDPEWNRGTEKGSIIYMGEHPNVK